VPHRAGEASGYTRPCGLGKGASRQLGQTIVLSRAIRKATHPSLSPPAWTFCYSSTRLLKVGELPLISRQYDYRASNQPSLSMMSIEIRPSPWKSGLACGSRGLSLLRTSAPSTTSPKMV